MALVGILIPRDSSARGNGAGHHGAWRSDAVDACARVPLSHPAGARTNATMDVKSNAGDSLAHPGARPFLSCRCHIARRKLVICRQRVCQSILMITNGLTPVFGSEPLSWGYFWSTFRSPKVRSLHP